MARTQSRRHVEEGEPVLWLIGSDFSKKVQCREMAFHLLPYKLHVTSLAFPQDLEG